MRNVNRICVGKSCLVLQQLFPHTSLLNILRIKLLANFIARHETWQFYLFFPAHKMSGI